MTSKESLLGKTIVVTRPLAQAQKICESLELLQAKIIHFPTLRIIAADDLQSSTQTFKKLSTYKIIIFTSANAVHFAVGLASKLGVTFNTSNLAAIGPATKVALEHFAYQVGIYPESEFTSEALLQHHAFQNVNGQDILIVKGQGGREYLQQELESRGAKISNAVVYQRSVPENRNPLQLTSLVQKDTLVLLYSAEAAQNLWSMCSKNEQAWLTNVNFLAGSSRIAEAATSVGVEKKPIIAENPSDEAMLQAVINWAT